MMIQKRADELKPGDVLPANAAYGERVVLLVGPSEFYADNVAVKIYNGGALDTFSEPRGELIDVESPDLTPAQQHAEELAGWVEKFKRCADDDKASSDYLSRGEYEKMAALLYAIKPPEPPTLAEALEVLKPFAPSSPEPGIVQFERVRDFLMRAKKAGLL